MKCDRLGRYLRAKRLKLGLRQADVAVRAGTTQQIVSEIELGRMDDEKVGTIDRIGLALGIPLGIMPLFDRADMDRVLDSRHAEVVEAFLARLSPEWEAHPEESYNVFGERADVDVAGWNELKAALAVTEMKADLTDIGGTVRGVMRKARLLPRVVLERYGWRARFVGVFLVVLDTSANRRAVRKYAETFDAAFRLRGKEVGAWLDNPDGNVAGLLFLSPTSVKCTRKGGRGRGRPEPPQRGRGEPDSADPEGGEGPRPAG